MKKFEAISKQIDAMLEILKKEDMSAQDAKNLARLSAYKRRNYKSFLGI